MAYRIVNRRWESGEHYRMLVDVETGMPPWWPTLFVTTQLRNAGRSVATMEAALEAIKVLLAFAEGHGRPRIGFKRQAQFPFPTDESTSGEFGDAVEWMRDRLDRLVSTLHPRLQRMISGRS